MTNKKLAVRCTGKSMLPLLSPGGVALINPSKTALAKGDVVLLRQGSSGYIHRIISIDSQHIRIQTQGDNAKKPDSWTHISHVEGVVTQYLCHNTSINLERASIRLLGRALSMTTRFFFQWKNTRWLIRQVIKNPKTHRIIHSITL